jgi:hypothetical protein
MLPADLQKPDRVLVADRVFVHDAVCLVCCSRLFLCGIVENPV